MNDHAQGHTSTRVEAPGGSLHNVKTAPAETKDVAGEHPDVV